MFFLLLQIKKIYPIFIKKKKMEKIEPKIKFVHYVLDKLSFQEKSLQPIEIAIINYSNKILLIITQMNKIGNIVDHFHFFFLKL